MEEKWVPKLREIVINKMQNGGFKRGELTKLFKTLAEEFNEENADKLKNYYYRVLKKEIEESNNTTSKPNENREETETNSNNVIDETNVLELTFYKDYPGDNIDIFSYKDKDGQEWINFSQVDRNIAGRTFKNYMTTLENGKLIQNAIVDGKRIEVIEKEKLVKILGMFSGYTRHINASRQAEILAYLFEATNEQIEQRRAEKIFESLKFGDIVSVQVGKLMPYGVMVSLVKTPLITGMIHISEIKNGYVEDLSLYFEEGQILDAKVLQKRDGFKLALSTKGLKVPLLSGKEEVETAGDHLRKEESQPQITSTSYVATSTNPQVEVEVEQDIQIETNLPEEWNNILDYVKSYVGPLSPEAKQKLKHLIQEYGLFKFSLAINESTKDFKNDLGLILLSKAESKLRDGL
jgi:predicted RNA-binding protein with RPS1 domain